MVYIIPTKHGLLEGTHRAVDVKWVQPRRLRMASIDWNHKG
jgi:hypothetical protein